MHERSLPEKDIREGNLHAQTQDFRLTQSLLNTAGLGVITTTREGVITGFNQRAETLLGYPANEVVGKCTPLIFYENPDAVEGLTVRGKDTQKPSLNNGAGKTWYDRSVANNECELLRKNGSKFHARVTVCPVHDGANQMIGYAGVIADLTEQAELRGRLRSSEERFRLLTQNVPGAVYLCNNDEVYSVIFINDYITTITGYKKEDFYSGKITFENIFHPDDRAKIHQTIDRGIAERRSYKLRYRVRHASGTWRWVDETGIGIFENDKLTMLEGFILDVTLQKESEEKLWKAVEENLRFFNSPVNLNAVTDLNANLIRISPSWTKILGWEEAELQSQSVLDFIHPEDVEQTQLALKDVAASPDVTTIENRLRCRDGSFRWMLWAVAADLDIGILYASAIDISARKKSEKNILDSKANLESVTLQLQEQNRKLDEFAHIISHNLRAPISNIQALINLLDERSEIGDYQLVFDKLKKVAKNIGETMNELMDTLKAKTEQPIDLTDIRFKEVLDKVVQSLEGELIVAEASVTFDFNEVSMIKYSKPYLESIFQNLLTNAIKYRSPHRKPSVHFKSVVSGQHLELHVSDNGQGIDLEKFGGKLFGLHKTFHKHQEARGVGLFLVKTQVESLGGTIRVMSEVDKGTTFIIRFF